MNLDPKVFEAAAALLINHPDHYYGCCYALYMTAPAVGGIRYVMFFNKCLMPGGALHVEFWYNQRSLTERQNRNARVFGLLLCAELIKDRQGDI